MNTTNPDPVQLIIGLGSDRPGTVRDVLTDYAQRLPEAGCFPTDMSPRDLRLAVCGIVADLDLADDPDAVAYARDLARRGLEFQL